MAPRAAWVKTRRGHYYLAARFSGNLKVHAARSACGNVSNKRSQPWETTEWRGFEQAEERPEGSPWSWFVLQDSWSVAHKAKLSDERLHDLKVSASSSEDYMELAGHYNAS